MLSERGIGHIVRADAPASGMSVLSIRRGPDRVVPQPGGVLDHPHRSPRVAGVLRPRRCGRADCRRPRGTGQRRRGRAGRANPFPSPAQEARLLLPGRRASPPGDPRCGPARPAARLPSPGLGQAVLAAYLQLLLDAGVRGGRARGQPGGERARGHRQFLVLHHLVTRPSSSASGGGWARRASAARRPGPPRPAAAASRTRRCRRPGRPGRTPSGSWPPGPRSGSRRQRPAPPRPRGDPVHGGDDRLGHGPDGHHERVVVLADRIQGGRWPGRPRWPGSRPGDSRRPAARRRGPGLPRTRRPGEPARPGPRRAGLRRARCGGRRPAGRAPAEDTPGVSPAAGAEPSREPAASRSSACSRRSCPAQKACPAPVISTARTSGLDPACRNALSSSVFSSAVSALRA